MSYELDGKTIEATENGYLVDANDWSEDLIPVMAAADGVELTDRHIDVVKYLRDEHVNNGGNEPNERQILKAMSKVWGEKLTSKIMYEMFPGMPSKQGRKWAGLPQSTRKGGY
jgi:TusE/DsrC/DsvC family sulfur relay protein